MSRITTTASIVAVLLTVCGCGASSGSGSSAGLGGSGGSGGDAPQGSGGAGGSGGSGAGGGAGTAGGGGQPQSDCEVYCSKADKAGCMPSGCVASCQATQPTCNSQVVALTHCAAATGTITCSEGKPQVEGCSAELAALATCEQAASSCYANEGECDPTIAATCDGNKACVWEPNDNYKFFCETPGSVPAGGACSFDSPCAARLYCDDDVCRPWCCDDSGCSGDTTCTFVAAGGTVQVQVCK